MITITTPFFLLSILNLFDGVVTWWGLQNQLISESNPMMNFIYQLSPELFLLTKVLFSMTLYFVEKVFPKGLMWLVKLAIAMYTVVFCLHIYWLAVFWI